MNTYIVTFYSYIRNDERSVLVEADNEELAMFAVEHHYIRVDIKEIVKI